MGQPRSQVFLTDEGWIQRLIARVPEASFGVEWASGTGALTEGLSRCWDRLVAMEIELKFCSQLRKIDPEFLVICADITTFPLPDRSVSYPLVGNLPYHQTGPLLIRILRTRRRLEGFYGLVQREVAERLSASPGDSEYGGLSLLGSCFARIQMPVTVPPEAFEPRPEVESAWVEMKFHDSEQEPEFEFERVRRFVRRCFRYPRKTLVNNLAESPEQKEYWNRQFDRWNWSRTRRPGTLSPDELERLMRSWNDQNWSWPRIRSSKA